MKYSNTKTKYVVYYPRDNRFWVTDYEYGENTGFTTDVITEATLFETVEEIGHIWNALLKKISYKKDTIPLEIMKVDITEVYEWEKIK